MSGNKAAVEALVGRLEGEEVFAKLVKSCGVAFHSPALAPVGPVLENCLKAVIPHPKIRSKSIQLIIMVSYLDFDFP